MMMHILLKFCLIPLIAMLCLSCYSQENNLDNYTGTFLSSDNVTSLQARTKGKSVEGVLYEQNVVLPFKGISNGNNLSGHIYMQGSKIPFTATYDQSSLTLNVEQNELVFNKTSQSHMLSEIDLSPYFGEPATTTPPNNSKSAPQRSNKYGSLRQLIAGSQLVLFIRSSYVSDNTASSITYFNFCPNGTFHLSSDASYSVEGNYGGNVHGGGRSDRYGRWEVITHEGSPAVKMTYADGDIVYNPIDEQKLSAGRWKQGNRQYAFQRNKAVCR